MADNTHASKQAYVRQPHPSQTTYQATVCVRPIKFARCVIFSVAYRDENRFRSDKGKKKTITDEYRKDAGLRTLCGRLFKCFFLSFLSHMGGETPTRAETADTVRYSNYIIWNPLCFRTPVRRLRPV